MSDATATDILFETRGPLGLVTLNRPSQLNALTHDMIHRMRDQLLAWASDPAVVVVAVRGAGDRAFCAGGDVRKLYEDGHRNSAVDGAKNVAMFADEYRLNTLIKRYPKPYIAFMDGVVMGGGVGVSIHGRYRVGGDRTLFAMPETGIGLFPDVGGAYFLPRLPNHIGMHLALTGARLDVAECINAHLIDYATPSNRTEVVIAELAEATYDDAPDEVICEILALNSIAPAAASLAQHTREIALCYGGVVIDDTDGDAEGVETPRRSVEEILAALDAGSPWAREQAAVIRTKSPTSLKYAFRQLRDGASLDFEDCMRMEYRLARACMMGHDFYEGVRAVVIEKDNAPKWSPATLDGVSDAMVDAAFAPLGADELQLG